MSKTIKITILVSIFCLGAVLLSGCVLFTGTDIEKICCEDCLEYIAKTPGAEKCLDNPEITKECREFFEKNPTKNDECLEGKIVTPTDVVLPGEPGTISPEQEAQNQEVAQYYEFKKKYENKKWRGAMNGEVAITMTGTDSCTQRYTARINEMRMIFNGPPGDRSLLRHGELLSSIEIGGKAVLESAHISCTCAELNVEISSFPFNLAGGVNLSEGTINFGAADPEAHKEFKVLYIYTPVCGDPPPPPFYGDNEPLFSLFEPKYTAFKFDGDKITLTSAFGNLSGAKLFPEDTSGVLKGTNTKETISGELNPF